MWEYLTYGRRTEQIHGLTSGKATATDKVRQLVVVPAQGDAVFHGGQIPARIASE
jgi:hypothetical protein